MEPGLGEIFSRERIKSISGVVLSMNHDHALPAPGGIERSVI
jgi:hypothetical protein